MVLGFQYVVLGFSFAAALHSVISPTVFILTSTRSGGMTWERFSNILLLKL
jgi:hypothetical protein